MSPEKLTKYEKVNQDMAYAALAVLAFCVVLSIAVAWLTAEFPELVKAMPHVFNGKEVVNGSDSPNYIRNSAEFLNFITAGLGAIALAAVAIWALRFARQQANEATNTRLSGIYMEIVEKWQSDKLLDSREKLFRLIYKYEDNRDNAEMSSFTNAQEYIFYYLRELYDKRKLRELYSYTILIQCFEDLGYLSYPTWTAGPVFAVQNGRNAEG
jgi:hypothetical protein